MTLLEKTTLAASKTSMKWCVALFVCLLTTMLIGCGSSSSSSTSTSASNPSSGTGAATSAPDAFSTTIICCLVGRSQSPEGTVTVDTTANNGAGAVQITSSGNVPPNENMVLQFCPFPQNFNNCFSVASLTTDAGGNGKASFNFPQKGTFAGDFQFLSNGSRVLVTASATGPTGTNFKAAMLPAASITGGIGQTTGSAPGSGTISVTGTTPHIVLSGTLPNHAFQISSCGVGGLCSSPTTVTTDAQGNVSADVATLQFFAFDIFVAKDSSGVQFISAFRVQ